MKHPILAFTIAICISLLSGCGGAEAQSTSIGDAIKAAIASGKIPDLDTSDSLAGPDVDGNGVRDDIDRFIDKKDLTQPQKNSLKQHARAMQSILALDSNSVDVARKTAASMSRGMGCIYRRNSEKNADVFVNELEKFTMNTMARVIKYDKFNHALNGSMIKIELTDTCDE